MRWLLEALCQTATTVPLSSLTSVDIACSLQAAVCERLFSAEASTPSFERVSTGKRKERPPHF